jgi:hypothetical protein
MCIIGLQEPEVLKKDILAYKVVRVETVNGKRVFRSAVLSRSTQSGFFTDGLVFTYRIGKANYSPIPKTPGVFLYRTRQTARDAKGDNHAIIQVRVPAGTTIRRGPQFNQDKLTASRVIPLKQVR